MECILFKYRCRLLGKVPRTREEYDPAQLLDKLTADKTLVLDSENLPDDWKSFDLRTLLDDGDLNEEAEGRPSNPGVVNIDTTMEEELERSRSRLERVLVFTTERLLGLLALCKRGSVDGTFRSITRFWKQIFILMVEYEGLHIPIAMGWLPDKTAMSYYVFLWLVLSSFKERSEAIHDHYGSSKLKLRKVKCDFEVSIHLGFEMFNLSGCYFHFSQVT